VKKLATTIAAVALLGTPAFAAGMLVKAPPPAPVYDWTGWYGGVNAGAGFGNVKTDFNATPVLVTLTNFSSSTTPGLTGSNTELPRGFIGGGQVGYNRQIAPVWVVGLEADIQGAFGKDSDTLTSSFIDFKAFSFDPTLTGSTAIDYQTKIEWFGTVRGRIGYVWQNAEVVTYVTGGAAYGKVDLEGTSTVSGRVNIVPFFPPFSTTRSIGHAQANTGWVVGYGMEGRMDSWGARNWTWKVEGLYMDLGHLDDSDPIGATISSVTGGQTFTHTHFTDAILRGGLNYQFH
jgi:outer membrane immunogenic protein